MILPDALAGQRSEPNRSSELLPEEPMARGPETGPTMAVDQQARGRLLPAQSDAVDTVVVADTRVDEGLPELETVILLSPGHPGVCPKRCIAAPQQCAVQHHTNITC